jgi:hypothetical protein
MYQVFDANGKENFPTENQSNLNSMNAQMK